MLQLKNRTGFAGTVFLSPDPEGIDSLYTVVKATFALGERPARADEQVPLAAKDVHYADPALTSVRVPSDVTLVKPGTDVLLVGKAYAPGGRRTTQTEVSLAVGPVRKTVRVVGDRVWKSGPLGLTPSQPTPFESMPLVWERAYGGRDQHNEEPRAESRNPVGVGFRARDGGKELSGTAVANLEDPRQPNASWRDGPTPACFAPVAAHWEPRRSFAGTYDEHWQKHRAPFLPADFDARFFQQAPAGQVASGYLRGGEPAEIRGATPSGVLRFVLPSPTIRVVYRLDKAPHEQPANLDTVLIEPEAARLILVWRSVMRCDKKALRVNEVEITAAEPGRGAS